MSKTYKDSTGYKKAFYSTIATYCFHYYLDYQVDIWGRIGDGEDGRPSQGGLIHMRSVRFQEVFKLFWVEITVEVLWYLEGDTKCFGCFYWHNLERTSNSEENKNAKVTITGFTIKDWRISLGKAPRAWLDVTQRLIMEYHPFCPLHCFLTCLFNYLRQGTQPHVLVWPTLLCVVWSL